MNTIQYSPEAVRYMQQLFPWARMSRRSKQHLYCFSRFLKRLLRVIRWLRYRYSRPKYVIELAKTFGGWTSCAERTAQGKDFELILTVKMETRHPVGRSFGRKF